jgi:hypothetical protein
MIVTGIFTSAVKSFCLPGHVVFFFSLSSFGSRAGPGKVPLAALENQFSCSITMPTGP